MTDEPEHRRLEALQAAVDRAAADNRHPSAIISTWLVAISDNETTTNLAVELLEALSTGEVPAPRRYADD